MTFPERTNTDYAIKENSIAYDLNAVTVCFFARDNPYESGTDNQCLYSYAVTGQHNELTVCTSPALRVLIQGIRRYLNLGYKRNGNNIVYITSKILNLFSTAFYLRLLDRNF